jgi:hypothetical protein
MNLFKLKTAALIQTILMGILFVANAYFFFVDTDTANSIFAIQIILGVMMFYGITAMIINRRKLSSTGKSPSTEVIALVGLILFTLIATIGVLANKFM